MTEPVSQAQLVVGRFGGAPKMAEATGFSEQTIRNWLRAGVIPQKHWETVLAYRDAAPGLTLFDFLREILANLGSAILCPNIEMPGAQPASPAVPA